MKDLLLVFGNFFLASRQERLSHLLNSHYYEYKINILWLYHLHWVWIWLILIVFFRFWRFLGLHATRRWGAWRPWTSRYWRNLSFGEWELRATLLLHHHAIPADFSRATLLYCTTMRSLQILQGQHCYCTTMQSLQIFKGNSAIAPPCNPCSHQLLL